MSCECNQPYKSKTVSTNGSILTIDLGNTAAISNYEKFKFIVCQSIPQTALGQPVQIKALFDGQFVQNNLVDCNGDIIYAYQLCTRTVYFVRFSTDIQQHTTIYNAKKRDFCYTI